MEKKQAMAIAILIIVAIVLCSAILFLNNLNSFKFAFEKDNVLFVSNEASPLQLMREFNLNDSIFVSPAIFQSGPENTYQSNAFNLVSIVFIGNDKNTVSLWRVFDRSNKLLSCRTNNGDVLKDIELTAQDCQKILEDKNNAIVLISLPKDGGKSRIVFSQNRIEIIPEKLENLANVSFAFLKAMYANAELIIQKTNMFTQFVK